MFDNHLHTKYSSDSEMDIKDAIKKAESLNMGIIVTEHMDIGYPIEGKFTFDVDEYFNEYSQYRNDKLLLGIEMGMQECCINENRGLSQKYAFDHIIGSIHLVRGIDIFQESFYESRQKREAYTQYLEDMLSCVKSCEFINSLGHIDYISRYANYEDAELYYEDYCDIIDEIFKIIAERNIALELNTRRLPLKKSGYDNLINIFKRYYELGGRIATIGSDSHSADNIGRGFDLALKMLEECRIKPVYYRERKPQYMK